MNYELMYDEIFEDWLLNKQGDLIEGFIETNRVDFEDFMREGGLHLDDDGPDGEWLYVENNYYDFKKYAYEVYIASNQ